ncbi:MAG: sigma-70 family RNA polymerase sigma factor [Oscillibacter sp.]|nr:sigma-70 family RNA polymerase sigma factor [Oscillibacter sp.]
MYTRYFRLKDPKCRPEEIEWIEMSGREFYHFVNSTEGQGRYFIDMGDVVLEASKREAQIHRAEKDHSDYLKEQEEGWSTLSINTDEHGYRGEEIIADEARDVEAEAIMRIETEALQKALTRLDSQSYQLIHALYLADNQKTEREIAKERNMSQVAIHKQKKKALNALKFLVIKLQKSSQ